LYIYFYEKDSTVYLASIEQKANPNQNDDILKAYNIIHKLILTE